MDDDPSVKGARAYREWEAALLADPENRRLYEQEAAKAERWLNRAEQWREFRRRLIVALIILLIALVSSPVWFPVLRALWRLALGIG